MNSTLFLMRLRAENIFLQLLNINMKYFLRFLLGFLLNLLFEGDFIYP